MKELLFGKVTTYKGEEFYVNRDGANILSFDGNFGNVGSSLESGGGTFSIPKSRLGEFAIKYDGLCSYEDGVFKILDQEGFGKDVLSGVPLNEKMELI